MNLEKKAKEIKKDAAFKKCFESSIYSICPIFAVHGISCQPNYSILRAAHSLPLKSFSKEELSELKRLTKEAIEWVSAYGRLKAKIRALLRTGRMDHAN